MVFKKMSLDDEKKTLIERKRNILFLISQYLKDIGLNETHLTLLEESRLSTEYQICDNVDLDSIFLEFSSYHQLKFGKSPKIIRKVINDGTNPRSKSSAVKRNRYQVKETKKDKIQESNVLEASILVTSVNHGDFLSDNIQALKPLNNFVNCTPEWKEMAEIVCRDLIKKDFNIQWDSIYGANCAKSILKESVLLPIEFPELFQGVTKPWKSVLLHGAPGTGKTLIAKALSSQTRDKVAFFNVASSTIISKWRGDSEKFVRVLFDVAKFYSPSIIFIDEIEGLASKRDAISEHEASKRFKNELLTLLDGLDSGSSNIFVLANTNLPWEIDPAFLRRFERKILIDLPEPKDRIGIILGFIPTAKNWCHSKLTELSQISDGFTGDELRIACKETSMMEVRRAVLNKNTKTKNSTPKIEDLFFAIKQINSSSKQIIEKHREWNKKFGNIL